MGFSQRVHGGALLDHWGAKRRFRRFCRIIWQQIRAAGNFQVVTMLVSSGPSLPASAALTSPKSNTEAPMDWNRVEGN
jgi:hypothetical protein